MKKPKLSLAMSYSIIVCAALLIVSVVLGVVLMNQTGKGMSTLIRRHMIAVADTAAASLDGDMLGALTEDDVDSKEFLLIEDTLTKIVAAQKDTDIKYIYCVKKEGDHFVFTVDPDPVNPGGFGEPVVHTDAQEKAWEGVSSIDDVPYDDRWGSFYTAWSPVRNSKGAVVGLVGVDFVPDWYLAQESSHKISVVLCSALSLVVGIVIMVLLTSHLRRRMRTLNGELRSLSDDLDKLSGEIGLGTGQQEKQTDDDGPKSGENTIGSLSVKVHTMQRKLADYMDYVHKQAYTDSMTGVGNTTAYLEYIKTLNAQIGDGTASFALAVFDMNGLKNTNDNFGHECGDRLIKDAARNICLVFGDGRVFRIGGDEFIAILDHADETEIQARLQTLDETIEDFNLHGKQYAMTLSLAGGWAVYLPGEDYAYNSVMKRADLNMYRNKGEFYRKFGDRRRHYVEDETT